MGRLVMKFGGTSVANIERIRNVARHVKREVDAGHDVAVIVSAMSGKTNELVEWCREASPLHDAREYDAVVASGEQVTAGLLAIALQAIGVQARSFAHWSCLSQVFAPIDVKNVITVQTALHSGQALHTGPRGDPRGGSRANTPRRSPPRALRNRRAACRCAGRSGSL